MMGTMRKSAGTPVQPFAKKLVWPTLTLPPAVKTRTGEMVLPPETADAIQNHFAAMQQTLTDHLSNMSEQIEALKTQSSSQKS